MSNKSNQVQMKKSAIKLLNKNASVIARHIYAGGDSAIVFMHKVLTSNFPSMSVEDRREVMKTILSQAI